MNKYFDWSGTKGLHVIDDDAKNPGDENEVRQYAEFEDLFADLKEPTTIIGEATFESFRKDRRDEVVKLAEELGHEILVTATRATRRRGNELGYPKSDYHDPYVIRDLANDGKTHLKKAKVGGIDPLITDIREKVNEKLMKMRYTRVRVEGRKNKIPLKDIFAELIIKELPDFKELPYMTRLIIGDSNRYNKTSVAAIGVVTPWVKNGKELKKVCGLYQHGYPCQVRSDLMMHKWWRRFKRETTNRETGKISSAGKLNGQATLTDFTREHVHLFHLIKSLGFEKLDSIEKEIETVLEVGKKEIKKGDIKRIKHEHIPQWGEAKFNSFFG